MQAAMYLCGHEHVMQFKSCAGAVAQCVLGAVADVGFYKGIGGSEIIDQMDWWDGSYSRGFLAVTVCPAEALLQFVRADTGQVGVHRPGACRPIRVPPVHCSSSSLFLRALSRSQQYCKQLGYACVTSRLCPVMCMRFRYCTRSR